MVFGWWPSSHGLGDPRVLPQQIHERHLLAALADPAHPAFRGDGKGNANGAGCLSESIDPRGVVS